MPDNEKIKGKLLSEEERAVRGEKAGEAQPALFEENVKEQKGDAIAQTQDAMPHVAEKANTEEKKLKLPNIFNKAETTKPAREPRPPKPPKSPEQIAWEKAKHDRFIAKTWQPILRPITVLFAVCLIASLLLGLTNALTEPIILQNTLAEAEAARRVLLPAADDFEAADIPADVQNVTAMWRAENGTGWVIEAFGRGYGGKVPAIVAFGANGIIEGVTFPANNETVGLGAKITQDDFSAQFAGLPGTALTLGDIDAIASATISSGAAVNAVNAAISAYNLVTGTGPANVTGMSPEEVREFLLPGEELTSIGITAENVQPIAWRSESGNYIIYGEVESSNPHAEKPIVAAVAVSGEGVILNLWIDTSDEGESYGALLPYNTEFMDSFIGLTAPVDVDTVAGVTNSSTTVIAAVNSALMALNAAKEA